MRIRLPLLLLAALLPGAAIAAGFTVPMDQSRVLPFSGIAANVVVGNTDIADVRVLDSRTLVLVGKRPGMTNVMIMDAVGRTLFNDQVTVSANAGSAVTIYRGGQSQEMACSPYCQATNGGTAAVATPAPTLTITGPLPPSPTAAP